jgi:hypothetical protein
MTCQVPKVRKKPGDFLVIKADAGQLPLKSRSVKLVLATPPYIGATCLRKGDYCTSDPTEYRSLIHRFVAEVDRVLKPYGYLLITPESPPSTTHVGARFVKFNVFRKDPFDPYWALKTVARETYWTHFVRVESCWWAARPSLYRRLLHQYSRIGDIVVHVFSGSGNSGIAALADGRKPVLIDLHYHRNALRRLRRYFRQRESRKQTMSDSSIHHAVLGFECDHRNRVRTTSRSLRSFFAPMHPIHWLAGSE